MCTFKEPIILYFILILRMPPFKVARDRWYPHFIDGKTRRLREVEGHRSRTGM